MERFTTSDGITLAVDDVGPRDAEVTVVLLHGWVEDRGVWTAVRALLGDDVRVLAPDHRGHGRSDAAPRGSATIDRIADDVAELVAERAPTGGLVLVGHSMGGMSMMALAERHPDLVRDRVRGAMFVSTSSGGLREVTLGLPAPLVKAFTRARRTPTPRSTAPRPRRLSTTGALPVRNRALATRLLRWAAFGSRPDRADVLALVEQVARAHRGSSGGFRRALSEHERAAALGAYADVPTMVLVGDRDRITPLGARPRDRRDPAALGVRDLPAQRAHAALRAGARGRGADPQTCLVLGVL